MQIRSNHPIGLRPPPLHRRGISQCRHDTTTPSGYACHPSTGGEWSDTVFVQIRSNHPVGLRHRVQTRCDCSSVSVLDISPPQEGNYPTVHLIRSNHPVGLRHRVQTRCDCSRSICARHLPSTGGELTSADTRQPPRRASPPGTDAMRLQ